MYGCSMELAQGQDTNVYVRILLTWLILMNHVYRYIQFCMDRIRMLKQNGVEPVLVFDGAPVPAKEETSRQRQS